MTNQYEQPEPLSKWTQYIGPIIILVIAVGAAIFGLVWASDDDNAAPTEQETATAEDASEEQEALDAAQAEADMYIVSEYLLMELLTNPEYEYGFSQEAAEFAIENVRVDWNEEAHQFAMLAREEFPEATDEEIENLLQNEEGGPQFTAEQTEYAMSQLD